MVRYISNLYISQSVVAWLKNISYIYYAYNTRMHVCCAKDGGLHQLLVGGLPCQWRIESRNEVTAWLSLQDHMACIKYLKPASTGAGFTCGFLQYTTWLCYYRMWCWSIVMMYLIKNIIVITSHATSSNQILSFLKKNSYYTIHMGMHVHAYTQLLPYSATALSAWWSLASNDPGSAPGALPVGDPT